MPDAANNDNMYKIEMQEEIFTISSAGYSPFPSTPAISPQIFYSLFPQNTLNQCGGLVIMAAASAGQAPASVRMALMENKYAGNRLFFYI
jgi:hypothetical protein